MRVAAGTYSAHRPVRVGAGEVVRGERFTLVMDAPSLVTETAKVADGSSCDVPHVVEGCQERKRLRAAGVISTSGTSISMNGLTSPPLDRPARKDTDAEDVVCAVIKRSKVIRARSRKRPADSQDRLEGHGGGEQRLVLVDDVEPVEDPERIALADSCRAAACRTLS